ncbi:MAG: glycosyltransferase [Alphaproteobacteria bacterium]|jgi:glycosyltransferase involved in cell wall biosynthesis|nr:glycosyltransferase [Alphaproteobacteria bacterium]MDP6588920.1 glycosyltransferase [Alphaproteobacteria bacterium]MDP6819403.1 glycosyltransferase [Alphaproteobacteria bacterium]|tara:strand:+ start:657 stop:971 length:315 start_codon:yes stop_codon:yes gene_type:complete
MTATPTVSFLLPAYNQEAFVRDAVRSVLAQDYEPLEIILSDDCSSDRTFEIIENEASAYKGPHSVVLNRNEMNLGIEHINKLQQLASGTILVTGHGDDLSMPSL